MPYGGLADLVVIVHFGFVLFVVLGGLLAWRWPAVVWIHLPAALWGVTVEWAGWVCPLTPVEQWMRRRAGEGSYEGEFVARYVVPLLYPATLTRETQLALGLGVLMVNAFVYGLVWNRQRGRRSI